MAALFLMPVVFIIIMSLALKDVYSPAVKTLPYVVENRDNGQMADMLLSEWQKRHGKPQPSGTNWQDEVRRGRLSYALIIEKDFSSELAAEKSGNGKRYTADVYDGYRGC